MADDFLDKVFAEAAPAEEAPVVQEPEAAMEPTPETVAEPEPAPSQPEVVEQPEQARPGYVPIDAMLTEREKRQALERRVAEFEAQRTPQARPDAFDDPEGYDRHIQGLIQAETHRVRAEMSYEMACSKHGKDDVEAARTWALEKAQNDPLFGQQVEAAFKTQSLPVEWVVQQHKRDALVSQVGDRSMDDFVRDYLSKNPGLVQSAPPAPAPVAVAPAPAPKQAMPPRSIASDPAPVAPPTNANPMAAMDALFTR
jgi:hypothetical protein